VRPRTAVRAVADLAVLSADPHHEGEAIREIATDITWWEAVSCMRHRIGVVMEAPKA
jgi:hypothetical protein